MQKWAGMLVETGKAFVDPSAMMTQMREDSRLLEFATFNDLQAGGEDVITALTTICNKIWQTGEWPTQWTQSLVITLPKKASCSSARTTEQ